MNKYITLSLGTILGVLSVNALAQHVVAFNLQNNTGKQLTMKCTQTLVSPSTILSGNSTADMVWKAGVNSCSIYLNDSLECAVNMTDKTKYVHSGGHGYLYYVMYVNSINGKHCTSEGNTAFINKK